MCGSMVDIQSPTAEKARKKEERKKKKPQDQNRIEWLALLGGHKNLVRWIY